ncbi:SRPBCC domain-containing protein [Streptosporangium sp. NPDC051022]|uniref:SRPBCC family protein n=1 Tax=Streptosporangium sp. NPDC051022 TaxID=3155752 RepID=UPI00343F806F
MAMRFEHEFTVPVPVEQAWSALLDAERVAPCLPGAALETTEGDRLTGRMKVKVGPITLTYRGEATFDDVDEQARTLTLRASGKESRGPGTASATVVARLRPKDTEGGSEGGTEGGAEGPGDSGTRVTVETSFTVTGRPAQFGRGVMNEVGAKLIDRFAANLSALLEGGREAPPTAPVPSPETAEPGASGAETSAPPSESPAKPPAQAEAPTHAEVPAQAEAPSPEETPRPVEASASVESSAESSAPAGTASGEGPAGGTAEPVPAESRFRRAVPRRRLSAVPPVRETPTSENARRHDLHPTGTSRTSRTPDEEALDLLEIAGIPLLRRAAPLAGALAGAVLAGWLISRALRRRRATTRR